jgi:hypothetical protein
METTLDMGKNIIAQISALAKNENIEFDIMALKILDLGLRVYQSSLEKEDTVIEFDPITKGKLNKILATHLLVKEALCHVFTKERSLYKAYDGFSRISGLNWQWS